MVRRSGSKLQGRPGATLESKRTVMVRPAISVGRRRRRHLRRAAEARGTAEPGVKRHRGVGRADHQRDEGPAGEGDEEIGSARGRSARSQRPLQHARSFDQRDDVEQERQQAERQRRWRSSANGARAIAASVSRMPGFRLLRVAAWVRCHRASCRSWSCREVAEQPSRHPIGQQHGKQQEQIKDREGEHLLARRVALLLARECEGQHDHDGAGDDGGDAIGDAGIADEPRRDAERREDERVEQDLPARRARRRRRPAASARRRARNRPCGRAPAPRNAAAST